MVGAFRLEGVDFADFGCRDGFVLIVIHGTEHKVMLAEPDPAQPLKLVHGVMAVSQLLSQSDSFLHLQSMFIVL